MVFLALFSEGLAVRGGELIGRATPVAGAVDLALDRDAGGDERGERAVGVAPDEVELGLAIANCVEGCGGFDRIRAASRRVAVRGAEGDNGVRHEGLRAEGSSGSLRSPCGLEGCAAKD
jgi:hypothetical protein